MSLFFLLKIDIVCLIVHDRTFLIKNTTFTRINEKSLLVHYTDAALFVADLFCTKSLKIVNSSTFSTTVMNTRTYIQNKARAIQFRDYVPHQR